MLSMKLLARLQKRWNEMSCHAYNQDRIDRENKATWMRNILHNAGCFTDSLVRCFSTRLVFCLGAALAIDGCGAKYQAQRSTKISCRFQLQRLWIILARCWEIPQRVTTVCENCVANVVDGRQHQDLFEGEFCRLNILNFQVHVSKLSPCIHVRRENSQVLIHLRHCPHHVRSSLCTTCKWRFMCVCVCVCVCVVCVWYTEMHAGQLQRGSIENFKWKLMYLLQCVSEALRSSWGTRYANFSFARKSIGRILFYNIRVGFRSCRKNFIGILQKPTCQISAARVSGLKAFLVARKADWNHEYLFADSWSTCRRLQEHGLEPFYSLATRELLFQEFQLLLGHLKDMQIQRPQENLFSHIPNFRTSKIWLSCKQRHPTTYYKIRSSRFAGSEASKELSLDASIIWGCVQCLFKIF